MAIFNYKALPSGDILNTTAPTEALAAADIGTAGVDYDADYGFINIGIDEAQELSANSVEPTAVLSGLTVTESSPTEILISVGLGVINDYVDPENPLNFPLVWNDDATPYAIPNIATDGFTFVYLDRNLAPAFVYGSTLTSHQAAINRRDMTFLASVSHTAGTIDRVTTAKVTGRETYHQLLDFFTALGIFNAGGFDITPTVTGFSVSSGFLMSIGAGNCNSDRLENFIEILAQSPTTFTEFLGSTGTPIITNASTSVMNVTDYDEAGVLTPIPAAGKAVIKYLFMVPVETGQNISIMHGQTVYATEQDAIANADADYSNVIIPESFARNSLLLARWVVMDGADLSDALESQLITGAIFGTRIGVGGAGTIGGGGDFFGPASSALNELVTYSGTSGKTGSAESDVTVLAGLIKRILASGALTLASGNGTSTLSIDNTGTLTLADLVTPKMVLEEAGVSRAEWEMAAGTMRLGVTGFTDLAHLNFEFGFAFLIGGPTGWSRLVSGSALVSADGTTGNALVNSNTFPQGDALTYPSADGVPGDIMGTDGAGDLSFGAPLFQNITTDTVLTTSDKTLYVDASGGDILLTLADNPRLGEFKKIWIGNNDNKITLVSANPTFPIAPPPIIAEGNLQGAWTLNSDFQDRFLTTNRDLTQAGTGGAFVPVTVNGNAVNAFNFQKTAYAVATASAYKGVLGTSPLSFTCWYGANAGAPVANEVICGWGTGLAPNGSTFSIELESGLYVRVNYRSIWRRWTFASLAAANLFDGNMHHVAVTKTGAAASTTGLYIDGVAYPHTSQDNYPTPDMDAGQDFKIGSQFNGGSPVNAKLYDCRLFNTGLSSLEVTTIMNQDLTGGATLSSIPTDTIIDVNYNGVEYVITDSIATELLTLESRVETLESTIAARQTVAFRTVAQNSIALVGASFQPITTGVSLFYNINGVPEVAPFAGGLFTVGADEQGTYNLSLRGYATKPSPQNDHIVMFVSINGGNYQANPDTGFATTANDENGFSISGALLLKENDTVNIGYNIVEGVDWVLDAFSWDMTRTGQ